MPDDKRAHLLGGRYAPSAEGANQQVAPPERWCRSGRLAICFDSVEIGPEDDDFGGLQPTIVFDLSDPT